MARRGSKVLVAVTIDGLAGFRYGFTTNQKPSVRTQLGQQLITTAIVDISKLAISPQRPKPARATGETATGSVSGFCDSGSIATLRAAGFTIEPPKFGFRGGSRSRTLYVPINGMKYAWVRGNEGEGSSEVLTSRLGVKEASASDTDLIFSPNFPQPPRVVRDHPNGGTTSYFVEPDKIDDAIADGWSNAHPGRFNLAALRALASGG